MSETDPFNDQIYRLDVGDKPAEELDRVRRLLRHPLAFLVDLTVDEEVLGVVVPVERFKKMEQAWHAEQIRIAQQELDEGKGRPAEEVFADIRAKLLKMQEEQGGE